MSVEAAFALKLSQATRYGAIMHRGRGLKKYINDNVGLYFPIKLSTK